MLLVVDVQGVTNEQATYAAWSAETDDVKSAVRQLG